MATLQSRLADLITALGADTKALVTSIATNQSTAIIKITSATSYTFILTDAGKVIEATAITSVVLTVPPNSSVAFPIGTMLEITQCGVGALTISPGAGVTIRSRGNVVSTTGQWSVAYIRKRATDEWVLTGDLS